MNRLRALAALALVLSLDGTAVLARQAATGRKLTTIDGLRQYPGYFHLQNVLLQGELVEEGARFVFRADERDMPVQLLDGATATSGPVEVRAQLIDVGRLEMNDPRVPFVEGRDPERWPRPGEELVLNITSVTSAPLAATPSVRALALEPWRFEGQKVTVVGQFRARNVLGDLPASPAKGRYDFVLRSADAAIWVTGLRPRVGRIELTVDSRVDTGRWVRISGTVVRERGLVTIEGVTFAEADAPGTPATSEESAPPPVPIMPLEVVFSSPTPEEIEVAASTTVRVQFSRGLDPSTIADNVRVAYAGAAVGAPPLQFQHTYDAANRAIHIRFTQPLERFATVRVELLEGLKAFDGGVLKPWTLTFTVGG